MATEENGPDYAGIFFLGKDWLRIARKLPGCRIVNGGERVRASKTSSYDPLKGFLNLKGHAKRPPRSKGECWVSWQWDHSYKGRRQRGVSQKMFYPPEGPNDRLGGEGREGACGDQGFFGLNRTEGLGGGGLSRLGNGLSCGKRGF